MKLTITKKEEVEVKYLRCYIGVRYWEDSSVNGVIDDFGDLMPCHIPGDEFWTPIIELDSGQIINWKHSTSANVHYKSCDNNTFELLDNHKHVVSTIEGYVNDMMCPKEDNDGDYVIMDIDSNGIIQDWKPDISPFESSSDSDI